jgi:TonB family protein
MSSAPPISLVDPSANDRLKETFSGWFWRSLALAALLHFLVFAFWPEMNAADVSLDSREIQQLDLVQEFEIPPPPQEIVRPAVPVLSTSLDISEDITIGEVTFDQNPVSELPPPPTGRGVNVSDQPAFTPYEVKPELRNRDEYARELQRRYPPNLRDAGIGGTVVLWIRIDESGAVRDTRVFTSSGYDLLDEVAHEVMRETARFSPALNRDQRVAVWIQMSITFRPQ